MPENAEAGIIKGLLQVVDAKVEGRCAVGPQIIGHQSLGNDSVFPRKFAHQFQTRHACRAWTGPAHPEPRPRRRRRAKDKPRAIDFQIDLVKMPDRMRFGTALSQFRCNDRSEIIDPTADCFVRNCNSALREQILNVTKAKREPEIEPDRLVNDLRWEPISGLADFRHALRLPSRPRRDGVDVARAASGSRKSRAKMVVVENNI
jgi:hypothetical protein